MPVFRSRKPDDEQVEVQVSEDMLLVVDRAVHPFVVMVHDPAGFRAEQFRSLRNKLEAMNPDGASKSLVITSAIRNEGKTITAINLALAFAELERMPALLVDGDLRAPSVENHLNLNPEAGLSDVLLGRVGLERAIRESGLRNLSIMGAGTRLTGPSELITAPRIEELFARLKERFQYVIVDTPPALPATDASVMAARADGSLVVVRLEHSSKSLTREAIKNLSDLGANVLGTFVTEVRGLNPDVDPRFASEEDF
ncbi:MAG: CpsD/CapB family tyrosine-protein kinase [Planctomycetota bacterium]